MNPVHKTFIFFLKSDIEKPQFVFAKKRKIYLGKIFHCVDIHFHTDQILEVR